ncbi:MAG: hypothetical protein IT228_04835 [Flavobacteriales bacterium]|nr:hypothetical protein [Flavobacteriales bacterium]NUQ15130.1 hypothetical protein [Flavobacteriales bacterium]
MKRSWLLTLFGIVLGALAGWAYWHGWGCTNGCAITSSPVNSALYGGLMGALLMNTFKKEPEQPATDRTNTPD